MSAQMPCTRIYLNKRRAEPRMLFGRIAERPISLRLWNADLPLGWCPTTPAYPHNRREPT